ncbi:hypothetical protein Celal_1704 [Cellulophaga algicola DSM 14237]|uniref:Uncharacterized protein n=1 Tax=Cellulophaga algicola (strain DSM 14237 / IC166 / ACAM 630) TaxID=688270 RepID=E6XCL6_CELAD|nr:hypothetical protein [Cellulophaga algicola]ADV49005.1 hypothetical protein Celal_1704 [Cellulophaga algicola DSM 14237]
MITKEELADNYKRFSDSEIIKLHKEQNSLTHIALEVLSNEIELRKLNLTSISKNSIVKNEKLKLTNTTSNKRYYISYKKMKNTSYIYFFSCSLMIIGNLISFIPTLFIFSIITFFLGIYFYNMNEEFIQFEIREKDVLYYRKRNYYGKFKFRDFYTLYLNKSFEIIKLAEIKKVEKNESFIDGNNLYLINNNDEKIDVLLNINKTQLNEIYLDLKKALKQK